jgi:recombination associated protein RdgC
MFFKNARVYRLSEDWNLTAGELSEKLAAFEFVPCGSLDPLRYGFTAPIKFGTDFAVSSEATGCIMICAKRQEKILPAAVIREQLENKAREIRESERRAVGRKERDVLRDEIVFSLLPKAFTKSTLDCAYIDPVAGLIVVDSSNAKRAEDLLSKLREALGGLRCLPVSVRNLPAQVLTHWVKNGDAGDCFMLGESADFSAVRDGREVKVKCVDLSSPEVLSLIDSGMQVGKLSVEWRESVRFSIDYNLALRGIKFGDSITEKANDKNPETYAEQFTANFDVMSFELRAMIADVVQAHGGFADDC